MNPMTNVKNIQKLNDKVLQLGVEDGVSWHKQYKDSAYIFIAHLKIVCGLGSGNYCGLPFDLTEGDILCVFSQYGEIVDVNLVRDKSTGKSKGYGFLCYEDQRSTILAVDNLNGIKLGGRTIRVDHVANYRRPKGDEKDESGDRKELPLVSCAPKTPPTSESEEEAVIKESKKKKKSKKRVKDSAEHAKEMKDSKCSPTLERERKIRKRDSEEDENRDNLKDKRNKRNQDGKLGGEIGQDKSVPRAKENVKDRDVRREKDSEKDRCSERERNNDRRKEKEIGREREWEKQRERGRDRR